MLRSIPSTQSIPSIQGILTIRTILITAVVPTALLNRARPTHNLHLPRVSRAA
jgi:hypothetical protein